MRLAYALFLLVYLVSPARADVLDSWCAQAKLPSSIAICSDQELRALAIERQHAFDAARARIGERQSTALLADQNAWVVSYPPKCGLSPNSPPLLPLSPQLQSCMAAAGRDRIRYLNSYGSSGAGDFASSPSLNCSRTSTRTEKALCSQPLLKSADDEMARAYTLLYSALPSEQSKGLLADQRLWIVERDKNCEYAANDGDFVQCLITATKWRQKLLSSMSLVQGNDVELQPQLFQEAKSGLYKISIFYPNINNPRNLPEITFNNLIRNMTLDDKSLAEARQGNSLSLANDISTSYEITLTTKRLISVMLSTYKYLGGAHGLGTRETVLFDLDAGRRLELRDVIGDTAHIIPEIARFCGDQLRRDAAANGWAAMLMMDGAAPIDVVKDFRYWSVSARGVDILFDPYSIAAYAAGAHECHVGYTFLTRWFAQGSVLAALAPSEPEPTPPPRTAPDVAGITPQTHTSQEVHSTGTAFSINEAGDLLTNYHVIKDCQAARVVIDGRRLEVVVSASDERNDLAVVHLGKENGRQPLRFREGNGIRPADGVVALGFPYAGLLASAAQITTGTVSALAGLHDDIRYLQITAPVQPGNSGGPLLDLSGNIVGVVTSRINAIAVAQITGTLPENVNFAIKNSIAREFLDTNRVTYTTARSDEKLEPADIGDVAAKSTVLVECLK